MRFLSPHECVEWCGSRGYPSTQHPGYSQPTASEPTDLVFVAFALPEDSGRKVVLGRLLFSLLEPADEYLLWLGEWGVWASNQHMPLMHRLRQAHGEPHPLIEAPGLLFTPAESDDALSFLVVALMFVWDCHVFSSTSAEAFHVSHDEQGWYGSRSESRTASAERQLSTFFGTGSA